ncbi:MAG: FHA domain-containing protein [Myxococcota bacterium]
MEATRYARVQSSVAPLRDACGVTRVASLRPSRSGVEHAFVDRQRMMASALLEETHDGVDLALPLDDALSLRHVLFVVRRGPRGVRFTVLGLSATDGLTLEGGPPVRRVDAEGMVILTLSAFTLFCVPTGEPLPWLADAPRPWSSLLPRVTLQVVPSAAVPSRSRGTGVLRVTGRCERQERRVDAAALERGVLIGRDPRCDVVIANQTVSRVHAALLLIDGDAVLADAGSTNGLWRAGVEVGVAALRERAELELGEQISLRWSLT